MVSQRYLREKPPPPSRLKDFFDQRVVPVAIDAAGSVEVAVEALASQARRKPFMVVGLAFALAALLPMLLRWRQTEPR